MLESSQIEASAQETMVSGVISGADEVSDNLLGSSVAPSGVKRGKNPDLQTAPGHSFAWSKLLRHAAPTLASAKATGPGCFGCHLDVAVLEAGAILAMTYILQRDSPCPWWTAL